MSKNKMKIKRKIRETLVIVGEGETEEAFLNHLKSFYSTGNLKIKIKSAGGKGPNNVIGDAIGTLNNSGCDRVAALLDMDLQWPVSKVKEAHRKKIILVGVDPCIEAMLIDILEEPRPYPCTNATCKNQLHPQLDGRPTNKNSYVKLFEKNILDKAKDRVEALDLLIKVLSGQQK